MKPSEIYLKAAQMVFNKTETYCCMAVSNADRTPAYDTLAMHFCQSMGFRDSGDIYRASCFDYRAARELRVWLLCMASAVADYDERRP